MNVVMLVSDTFRWDYLGCYGNEWIQTPNLDGLSAEGVRYLRAFGEGLPTIQARRVLMTGRPVFPFRYRPQLGDTVQMHGWHPLFDEDVTLAEHLKGHGFVTCMVTDVYHMMKPGKNFHRGFDCWYWIRGQENDAYALRDEKRVADLLAQLPPSASPERVPWMVQHLVNRSRWRGEEDTSVAQVMRVTADWVRDYNLSEPFFLYVDCFDPHEPWDPPLTYARHYKADFRDLEGVMPPWQGLTEEELASARAAYAGEVTLVDHWIGHLLKALRESGRYDETLIVFTSDHGTMMGEQGEVHKREDRLRNQVTQVPLIIRHPKGDGAGTTVEVFVQHQDIAPTVLALLGIDPPQRMTGLNIWPVGRDLPGRNYIISGFGHFASVRTGKWNYITPWTQLPEGRQPRHELYDLQNDPAELHNVLDRHPQVARQLRERLTRHVKEMAPRTDGRFQLAAPGSGRLSFDCVPLGGSQEDSAKM